MQMEQSVIALCVTFTINCEEPCGAISEFAFSNGTDNLL